MVGTPIHDRIVHVPSHRSRPAPSAHSPAAAAPLSSDNILSTIEKLHGLLAKGILKPEEFEAKKAELLRRLN